MADVDPADRQQAIDFLKTMLLQQTTGHTEQEAEDVATAMVDQAIADKGGSQ